MPTLDQARLEAIDLRGRLIRDPLLRLRYLRRMTACGLLCVEAAPAPPPRRSPRTLGMLALALILPAGYHSETIAPASRETRAPVEEWADTLPSVWGVDKTAEFDIYSNGLRVENQYAVANRPRRYAALVRSGDTVPDREARQEPAGIVFHSTESHMLAFEPEQTVALRRVGKYLLEYVRDNRSYHFVVDRFGRVHRVVQEGDAANHAGWSVWADDSRIYVNLNESFLAVAFEAQSRAEDGQPTVNTAQVHAGRVLTEMLRAKYRIPGFNCVTHAQVSVSPRSGRVGYHTDWADNFPYRAVGLPDNYGRPLMSVLLFGFSVDSQLEETGVGRGLRVAETLMRREALARRTTLAEYRNSLRLRWRAALSALEKAGTEKEKKL
ncbi:MAG TPA: peptidoglycan recognition family protein [Bryobacteraceae bacterium]|nr:peptidoglycan recognition family protein [Bryobacteraceae bacterium]